MVRTRLGRSIMNMNFSGNRDSEWRSAVLCADFDCGDSDGDDPGRERRTAALQPTRVRRDRAREPTRGHTVAQPRHARHRHRPGTHTLTPTYTRLNTVTLSVVQIF
jgi:hypothetical protein